MQSIMIGALSLYEIFAYFFLYSFLGWVVEVAFHAVTQGKFVNRGFLNGPVCPIYGVGMTAILLLLGEWITKYWLVFLIGVAFPTLIELFTGWALEKFFHDKWWDYSSRKFNFKGYICLEFSILWGIAVLLAVAVVHPAVRWFAFLFNELVGTVLVCACCAALIADITVTVLQVLKLNEKLKEIDEAAKALRKGSVRIGEIVAGVVLATGDVAHEAKEAVGRARTDLKERFDGTVDSIVAKMPKRLLKAFPSLSSRRNPDSVSLAKESLAHKKEKPEKRIAADGTEAVDGTEEAAAAEKAKEEKTRRERS